jgi:hypothetical protein
MVMGGFNNCSPRDGCGSVRQKGQIYACMVKRMASDTREMVPLPFTGSDTLENRFLVISL